LTGSTIAVYITIMVVNSETTVRKLVSLPKSLVKKIEDFRFDERIKTESETIRRLIEIGLKTVGANQSREK
jgi:metal-responsive CopG/Arc/MetJ family transcriptional regulator